MKRFNDLGILEYTLGIWEIGIWGLLHLLIEGLNSDYRIWGFRDLGMP